VGIVITVA